MPFSPSRVLVGWTCRRLWTGWIVGRTSEALSHHVFGVWTARKVIVKRTTVGIYRWALPPTVASRYLRQPHLLQVLLRRFWGVFLPLVVTLVSSTVFAFRFPLALKVGIHCFHCTKLRQKTSAVPESEPPRSSIQETVTHELPNPWKAPADSGEMF